MYANRPENKHPLALNAWTACFLTPLLAPGRDFNWLFWFFVKCSPYVALSVTVFIEFSLILFIEQIVDDMKDIMIMYATDEHVSLKSSASIISVDLELCCVAVLAAAVMASELLPALHFFMWVWGAGAIGDDRFQPEVGEDEEQPEPVEIWWPFRLFWLLAAAGRVYLAVRLFNCAAGHVIYSGFDETSGVSDPNEKLLNAAAMVFVVEIDDIFGELTLPPGLRGLLERVPAVSGTIYGQDPSVPEKNQSVAEFLGVEAWLCSTRFMGFGIVTMFTTVLWQSAIWDTGEGEEDFVWDRLRMIHGAPIFLYFVMWAIHCMILRQSNRVEMQKSLEEGQPGQREATQATHVTQEPLDAKAEADAEAASPGSPGPSLPGTVAGGDDS